VIHDAQQGRVDPPAEPPALRSEIDERDGRDGRSDVHGWALPAGWPPTPTRAGRAADDPRFGFAGLSTPPPPLSRPGHPVAEPRRAPFQGAAGRRS
jgi:hypothetical protein